jgi:hypothetical protein
MFRPQERLLGLIIFSRVRGDLSLLDHPEFMKELFGVLKVGDFKREISHILANMASVFGLAANILEDAQLHHRFYTFYSFYLKKSHLMFNSDALLMKIIYKMVAYYNATQDEELQFDNLLLP